MIDNNLRFIRDEFHYLGIRDFQEKEIGDKIRLDTGKFQISGEITFMQYAKGTAMNYDLHFKKHERPNMYLPYQYQATLKDDLSKTHPFRVGDDTAFTMQDAFNLLNGRALRKLVLNWSEQKMHNAWFQLDFGAKDIHGNFKLERLPVSDRDYVVSTSLDKYPILEMKYPEERTRLILSLIRGNVEPITLLRDGKEVKAFAEASPKNRSVAVYSEPGKVLVESKIRSKEKAERMSWEQPGEQLQKRKRKGKSL